MTAKVDPITGNITEYHTTVKIAFGVKHSAVTPYDICHYHYYYHSLEG